MSALTALIKHNRLSWSAKTVFLRTTKIIMEMRLSTDFYQLLKNEAVVISEARYQIREFDE